MVFSHIADKAQLAKMLAVGTYEIDHVFSRLGRYYRPKPIAKPSGGLRNLLIPQGELLIFQQKIKRHILDKVAVLSCVHGGIRRRSVLTNAEPHVSREVVFSVDIKNFFPHVDPERVFRIFRGLGFGDEPARILSKATTWKFQLPQGSPTSTALANLSLIHADSRILRLAKAHGFNYTRFVDDLTLSGSWRLLKFRRLISRIIESEGFEIKPEKTLTMDCGMRQIVTKLVVNGKINLCREQRRAIRREVWDSLRVSEIGPSTARLKGRLYWMRYVNPGIGDNLICKLRDRVGVGCA